MTDILKFAGIYQFYQWLAGAGKYNRLFANCYLRYTQDQKILDLGCGPADILKFLPKDCDYTGIDLNPDYIAKARKKYRDKSFFIGDINNPDFIMEDGIFDTVFCIGVQHHLPDTEVDNLLKFAFNMLKKGGRLLTLEPVYCGSQGRLELFIRKKDRGKFIRTPEDYMLLTNKVFKGSSYKIICNAMTIPFTIIIITGEKQ